MMRMVTYINGIEAEFFNYVERSCSQSPSILPVLGGKSLKNLTREYCNDSFITTRSNWIVQSSAVDFLHIFLTVMEYLIQANGIDAQFSLSIHDQIKYISSIEDRYRTALAFQIAHLITRAHFSKACGVYELPLNCAFFSSGKNTKTVQFSTQMTVYLVEIDCTIRKNVNDSSGTFDRLPAGEELNIHDILEHVNSL